MKIHADISLRGSFGLLEDQASADFKRDLRCCPISAGLSGSKWLSATGISSWKKGLKGNVLDEWLQSRYWCKIQASYASHFKGRPPTSKHKNYTTSELNWDKNSKMVSYIRKGSADGTASPNRIVYSESSYKLKQAENYFPGTCDSSNLNIATDLWSLLNPSV